MVILPRLAVSCFWKERLQSYLRWRVGFGCPILLCRVRRAKCGSSWIFLIVTWRTEYAYLIKFYEQNLSHCNKFRISKARRQPQALFPGGVHLGILRGGVPPGSPNPNPTSDKKNVIFHTCFLTGARFSKVPVTFRARSQIFKSKYKE